MKTAYELTVHFVDDDEEDPENFKVRDAVEKLAHHLGGSRSDENSDSAQLCVYAPNLPAIYDLLAAALSYGDVVQSVCVEAWEYDDEED